MSNTLFSTTLLIFSVAGAAGLLLIVTNVSPTPDSETADVFPDNFVAFIAAEAYGHRLVRNAVVSVPAPSISILFGAGAFFLLRR